MINGNLSSRLLVIWWISPLKSADYALLFFNFGILWLLPPPLERFVFLFESDPNSWWLLPLSANLNYLEKSLLFVGDSDDLPGDKIDVDFSSEVVLIVWLLLELPVLINPNSKGLALNEEGSLSLWELWFNEKFLVLFLFESLILLLILLTLPYVSILGRLLSEGA